MLPDVLRKQIVSPSVSKEPAEFALVRDVEVFILCSEPAGGGQSAGTQHNLHWPRRALQSTTQVSTAHRTSIPPTQRTPSLPVEDHLESLGQRPKPEPEVAVRHVSDLHSQGPE